MKEKVKNELDYGIISSLHSPFNLHGKGIDDHHK